MVTLGVLERLRVYMESAFVSIRRLLFALLENCVEHCSWSFGCVREQGKDLRGSNGRKMRWKKNEEEEMGKK